MEITDILSTKFQLSPTNREVRKSKNLLMIFEEAQGIPAQNWDAAEGMFIGDDAHWPVLYSPITVSGVAEATSFTHQQLQGNLNEEEAFESIESKIEEAKEDLNRLKKYFKNKNAAPKILEGMGEINPNNKNEIPLEDLQLLT